MVNQILDLVTPSTSSNPASHSLASNYSTPNCPALNDRQDEQQATLIPASELQAGQQVLYNGSRLKVRRVVPAFTRAQACHVHLVPLQWCPLVGVSQQLADRDEAAVLIRVACSVLRSFQVVA